MTTAWDDLPSIGRDPRMARGDQGRGRRRWIKWVVMAVLVVFLMVIGIYVALNQAFARLNTEFNNSLAKGFEDALSGATAANAAATVAAAQPPGTLSISALNAALPRYQWIDGATAVPYSSSRRRIVGIYANGTHIETVVQATPGECSFGLTVAASSDPLIVADHLPGPGTYWALGPNNSECVADQAPTSSWVTWDEGFGP